MLLHLKIVLLDLLQHRLHVWLTHCHNRILVFLILLLLLSSSSLAELQHLLLFFLILLEIGAQLLLDHKKGGETAPIPTIHILLRNFHAFLPLDLLIFLQFFPLICLLQLFLDLQFVVQLGFSSQLLEQSIVVDDVLHGFGILDGHCAMHSRVILSLFSDTLYRRYPFIGAFSITSLFQS